MPNRNIKYVFVKSELGAGTYGASLGVEALQLAASRKELPIFDRYPQVWIEDESEDKDFPPFAHNIAGLLPLYRQIAFEVDQAITKKSFPFIIAGDHANAAGSIAGIKLARPQARLGVIWIDAHADMHTPLTTPSGNMHGMPLAISMNLQPDGQPVNDVDADTLGKWHQLVQLGGIYPKIAPEDIVLIGIRELESAEWAVIQKQKIKHFTPEAIHSSDIDTVAQEALTYLAGCDAIYVSFDVDSMDNSIIYGTGTPSPNGLSIEQAQHLLQHFWNSEKLVALEITEINPLLDSKNQTAEVVCEIINNLINA